MKLRLRTMGNKQFIRSLLIIFLSTLFTAVCVLVYKLLRHGIIVVSGVTVGKMIATDIFIVLTVLILNGIIQKTGANIKFRKIIVTNMCVLFCSYVVAGISMIAYKLIVHGYVVFSWVTFKKLLILGLVIFWIIAYSLLLLRELIEEKCVTSIIVTIKRNWKSIMIYVGVIAVCLLPVAYDIFSGNELYANYTSEMMMVGEKNSCVSTCGEILGERVISQTFICEFDTISNIQMKAATYGRYNYGLINIALINDETGDLIETWKLRASEVVDNAMLSVTSENPMEHFNMRGKKYRIEITAPQAREGNAISLYYSTKNLYEGGTLIMDGNDTGGDLIFSLYGYDGIENYERVKVWLCIYLSAFLVFLLIVARRKRFAR